MLTLLGKQFRICDSLPRREFLKIGGLAMGGMSLPQLLQAESSARQASQHKAIIMIFLPGGPPHQDMYDLKPNAPSGIRGEFSPIATNVPGIEISDQMPRLAQMMDKFAIIRSLVGSQGRHDSFQCTTGRPFSGSQPLGGWPSIGSLLSKLHGPVDPSVPPSVDLSTDMNHKPWNIKGPGYLGAAHAPLRPSGEAMANMVLNGVGLDRLNDRKAILSSFDGYRRSIDANREKASGLDPFTKQALDVLTSPKLVEALDLEKEDPKVRARYGTDNPKVLGYSLSYGYQALMSKFLVARRLVEAGARFVTCSFAHFDWHGSNFANARKVLPLLDHGVCALVEDLHARGLDKDVSVVMWGEFGRTPKINKSGGRDHWPRVSSALLAGGGIQTGQVIGSTNRNAEAAVDRPVDVREVHATLYHNMGIDVNNTKLTDLNGRPQLLMEGGQPIRELV